MVKFMEPLTEVTGRRPEGENPCDELMALIGHDPRAESLTVPMDLAVRVTFWLGALRDFEDRLTELRERRPCEKVAD